MEDLLYVFSLGFSGSDALRAFFLILGGAFFVSRRLRPWKVTILLLIIDAVWPYVAMAAREGSHFGAELAFRGALANWSNYIPGFLVRAAGFYVAVRGVYSIRRRLHEAAESPKETTGKAKLLPF